RGGMWSTARGTRDEAAETVSRTGEVEGAAGGVTNFNRINRGGAGRMRRSRDLLTESIAEGRRGYRERRIISFHFFLERFGRGTVGQAVLSAVIIGFRSAASPILGVLGD